KDVGGNIWVVSNTNKVHVANRQFEKIPQKLPQIQALLVDYNDRLLIGTQKGLYLHQKKDKGESVYSEVKEAKNLNILSLYEDQFKNIWIGTFGDGVYVLNTEKAQVRLITEKDGLTNDNVISIQGKKNKLWLATFGGVTE